MSSRRPIVAAVLVMAIVLLAFPISMLLASSNRAAETGTLQGGGGQGPTTTFTTHLPNTTTTASTIVGTFTGTLSFPVPPNGDMFLTLTNGTVFSLQDVPLSQFPTPSTLVAASGSVFTDPYSTSGMKTMHVTSVSYSSTFSGTLFYNPVSSFAVTGPELITNHTWPAGYAKPSPVPFSLDFSQSWSSPAPSDSGKGMTVTGTVTGDEATASYIDTIRVESWRLNSSAPSYSVSLATKPMNFTGVLAYDPTRGFSVTDKPDCSQSLICPLWIGPTYWLDFSNSSTSGPSPSDAGRRIAGQGTVWVVYVDGQNFGSSTTIDVLNWHFV